MTSRLGQRWGSTAVRAARRGRILWHVIQPPHPCRIRLAEVRPGREGVFGIAQWFPGSNAGVALGPSEDDFVGAYAGPAGVPPDYPAVQAAAGAVIATHCARLADSTSRDDLWAAAASLETSTLFGDFKINPRSGAQVKHQTVLVRWTGGQLAPAGAPAA